MEEEKKKPNEEGEQLKEFKPIETQEQFDELIKARLNRQAEKIKKEAGAEIEELKKELAEAGASLEDNEKYSGLIKKAHEENENLRAEIEQLKLSELKRNALIKAGLPENLVLNVSGESESDINKSVEALAESLYSNGFRKNRTAAPTYHAEPTGKSQSYEAYENGHLRILAHQLFED